LKGNLPSPSRKTRDGEASANHTRPQAIVCLGATAAQGLFGRDFRVTQHRGEFLDRQLAEYVMATVRPSSILRAPDEKNRQEEMKRFVSDWKKITRLV
jgi:DNA polymerase